MSLLRYIIFLMFANNLTAFKILFHMLFKFTSVLCLAAVMDVSKSNPLCF